MKKIIAIVACSCLVLFGTAIGLTAAKGMNNAQGAETDIIQPRQNNEEAEAAKPVVLAETKSDSVKTATSNAKCDICGEEYPETQLKALNCGEHKACADCIEAKTEAYLRHTDVLPCGAYECDGLDHYRQAINYYCPDEPQHFKCECETPEHYCDACGETYPCEESNYHAKCAFCGKAWCTDDGRHGFCTICGGAMCDGGDHDKCTEPGCPYHNCEEHYHCPYCKDPVACDCEHICPVPCCCRFTCDGHTH